MDSTPQADWLKTHTPPPYKFVSGWRHKAADTGFHSHPYIELVYHVRGTGSTRVADGEEFTFDTGSVVVYPREAPHDQRMTSPGIDLCIHLLDSGNGGGFSEAFHLPPFNDAYLVHELTLLGEARPRASELEAYWFDLRISALMVRLLYAANLRRHQPQAGATDLYAERAYEYIRENYNRIDSIRSIADTIGISYDHLRHVFLKRFGISMKRWLMKIRVERAKDLLANSPLPHKAIAGLCGFDNESHFSASFKQLERTAPGAFRKNHQRRAGAASKA